MYSLKSLPIILVLILINLFTLETIAQPRLSYTLSMPEPHTHYFVVDMHIENPPADTLAVKMAVWTPGSYLVREFSRKVESFTATDTKGNVLPAIKTQKNTWEVNNCNSAGGKVTVRYLVYSYELSVRTSFLDSDMAFISPNSVFMYLDGYLQLPASIQINPPKNWNKINTALKPVNSKNQWLLHSPDFDTLADSPMLLGNQETITFTAAGIPHHLAIAGDGNHNLQKMAADIPRIVETTTQIFGEHPCQDYTFIQINTQNAGGGLEHLHSTALMNPRWNFEPTSNYLNWLGLVAHEYFHLWNVKRLRPIELGPFDYEKENYTRQLWIAEGFTDYYDDLILLRAGFHQPEKYLNLLAGKIAGVDSKPGTQVHPLAESSLDAWIKYYRPDENADNATVSYYNGGAVVAVMMDLAVRHHTKGEKNLDDLLRFLYKTYYKDLNRGFTEQEFADALAAIAGVSFTNFLNDYVYGTKPIDYKLYLGYAGLTLTNALPTNEPNLGITTTAGAGGLTISRVKRGSCGYDAGLNVNDEVIAVNNVRVSSDTELKNTIARYKAGDTVNVLVSRAGLLKTIPVKLQTLPMFSYSITKLPNPTKAQKAIYKGWVGADF